MASISSLGIGSGLDLNGLLDQLEASERQQLTPIVQKQQSHQAKISAYGRLESALTGFQDAVAKLADGKQFEAVKNEVTGDALGATLGDDALTGNYDLEVARRARGYSIATQGIGAADERLGAGALNIALANGDTLNVEVGEKQSTLEGIRDAINDAGGGVQAALMNDGGDTPYRLVLSSTETGTEAAIDEVTFSGGLGDALALDQNSEVPALNAKLTVNGIEVISQSNQVEGAIQGVTLNLRETGTATLDVTRDGAGIKKAVKDFAEAYNTLQETLDTLTRFNQETGESGALLGDATLRGIESRLRSVISGGAGGGEFNTLADLGITLKVDGTLEVDEEAVDDAVDNQLGALADFFTGTVDRDGLAVRLDDALSEMVDDGGTLDDATEGLETSIDTLQNQYTRTEERINSTLARYRTQFQQLDSMIAEMNSTSSYLTQQFDALNAQLGQ
ncbi:flagellar filament capping protein FliD [Alloalcanivorax profundimaris]|uniref:flagellar filament capping protein FliD n=1 Tax=Alloalcanivorax profundimaris TaxID=2735259 RepID=UPI001888CB38|nr:flagellar filament capping protein FliD [Alloalcanivorax profundimaris]MBF1800824.1 flagellar filament capping protein FliD [Alloalcanivorax profundimaris]MCQ6261728.1 flagellar filament capping protein FliD [Alcanivorax sp. MM125-6]